MSDIKKYKIQSIVFPKETKHMMCRDLFYHGENGYLDREEQFVALGMGQKIDFMTYLNACSWAKWRKYTNATNVSLNLDIEGSYELCFIGYSMEYRELVRREFGIVRQENAPRKVVSFEYADNDETIIGVEINASEKCIVYGGYYEAGYEGELNDINLCLATTTCRKEDFIRKNVQLLKNEVLTGNDDIKDHFTVHVVDNGRTLRENEIVGDHVFLHPNPNTGGSGGFARGMIEALHQEIPATHVLLMDDDVLVLPESIKRTYHLLRMMKDRYKECFISGAMLRYEKPTVQHEDVGIINQEGLIDQLKPGFDLCDLFSILKCEGSYYSGSNRYAAWWYCCIPITQIEKNGLPLPLFVRGDDIEYSLRCKAKIITMNSICVWHMGFGLKYNAAMDFYQVIRNFHIIRAASNILMDTHVHESFVKVFKDRMYGFAYNEMELIIRAFEDYMKGPDFLVKADGEKIIKDNVKLNERLSPLNDYPDIRIKWIEDVYADDFRKFTDKVLFHITDNGQKMMPEFMYKKPPKLPVVGYIGGMQRQKVTRVKKYAAVNALDETVIIRSLDKKRYKELMHRFYAVEKDYRKRHLQIEKKYREAQPYLVSEEFWRKYLGM